MNQPQQDIQEQIDAYRDGELDAASAARLQRSLADDPSRGSVFERESRWLGVLRTDAAPPADDDAAFTAAVLDRWERPRPVATLRRYSGGLIAAACVALVAGLMWIAGRNGPLGPNPHREGPSHVITLPERGGSDSMAAHDEISPVSRLVLSVSGSVDRQRESVRQARELFSAQGLRDLWLRETGEAPPPRDDETTRS